MSRILVIDDDESMCETLSMALGRWGFTVAWRTSAVEALQLLDEGEFAAVLTDLYLFGMDGITVCAEVARRRPGLPVVLMTAFGTAELAEKALRAGAVAFVAKPFDLELLHETLLKAVAR